MDNTTYSFDFRETSSSSHRTVVKKVLRKNFIPEGSDYKGAPNMMYCTCTCARLYMCSAVPVPGTRITLLMVLIDSDRSYVPRHPCHALDWHDGWVFNAHRHLVLRLSWMNAETLRHCYEMPDIDAAWGPKFEVCLKLICWSDCSHASP